MLRQRRFLNWKSLYVFTAVVLLLGSCAPANPTSSGVDELIDPDPPHAPLATVKTETECREGPSAEYPVRDTLKAEEIFEIQGRDQVGNAWLVFNPDLGDTCWVEGTVLELAGDLSLVEIINPDPPDKPSATVKAETVCFTGPGTGYELLGELAPDISYQIVGIDDEVTWLQIDLAAIINPDPPTSPVNELSPQPDPPGSVRSLRCWVPGSGVDLSGDLSGAPLVEMPVVKLLESAACLGGAAAEGDVEWTLDPGAVFRVLGVSDDLVRIDDDVTWVQIDDEVTWAQIDDDVTWVQIDDEVTWLQIDPTALVDPDPPHQPLNESSQQPEMLLRCWVPGDSGELSGDLSQVPVFPIPGGSPHRPGYLGVPDRSSRRGGGGMQRRLARPGRGARSAVRRLSPTIQRSPWTARPYGLCQRPGNRCEGVPATQWRCGVRPHGQDMLSW